MSAKTLFVVCLFSIAMAVLESAVVVYLRALYYPEGFTVALKVMDEKILLIEIAREAATVVMLLAIGLLAGKSLKEQFAYFLISFAVWDLFYYVWLKVFINWPLSVFDWDILFLIPITWLGPVLAPVVCSITMIALGILLLRSNATFNWHTWSFLAVGTGFVLYTFLVDYGSIIISNGFYSDAEPLLRNRQFLEIVKSYLPVRYDWSSFLLGEALYLVAIAGIWMRLKSTPEKSLDNPRDESLLAAK